MNNKVLILGLASPQADAIACCKSLGLEVHACADREAGLHLAKPDYFAPIDIKDAEAICRYARDHQIRVIYSAGSDLALPTISYAGAKLGLPHFVDLATVNLCSNKDQLRSFLGSDFFGNVRYLSVHSADEIGSWDIFPCVVKPVDSQGQRGFAVVTGREQLKNHLQRSLHYSPAGRAIIEEYIDGPEISVNLYLHEGRIAFAQTTDRIVFAQYPGIVKAHRIPSRVAGRKTEALVRRLCEALVQKLGLKNGPLYIQLKLKDGEPKLIELTPRLDGCHLWQLI
ncbi:MAG TPA: ATP-grasp domain-containing protein, partial [Bacillota bacterium]|nr:ATP-grasp domain-containing protein [Bacillota bacterium]